MKGFAVLLALSAAFLITPAFAQHHEWHGAHGTGGQHRIETQHYGGSHHYSRGYRGYGYGTYGRSSGCWAWDGWQWVWAC